MNRFKFDRYLDLHVIGDFSEMAEPPLVVTTMMTETQKVFGAIHLLHVRRSFVNRIRSILSTVMSHAQMAKTSEAFAGKCSYRSFASIRSTKQSRNSLTSH